MNEHGIVDVPLVGWRPGRWVFRLDNGATYAVSEGLYFELDIAYFEAEAHLEAAAKWSAYPPVRRPGAEDVVEFIRRWFRKSAATRDEVTTWGEARKVIEHLHKIKPRAGWRERAGAKGGA